MSLDMERKKKTMRALVLAGGYPQIFLIQNLKARGYYVILLDYLRDPVAKKYADKVYRISTLDVDAVTDVAKQEEVDFLITVCTDQALLTVAQVSERLDLPCYIDYETALHVTNKAYMKQKMAHCGINTAKFVLLLDEEHQDIDLQYPLIVKPIDCNSSKGVVKVTDERGLNEAIENARNFSRTSGVIVEEFISGNEISVDVYVENGMAKVLDISKSLKIRNTDNFVINKSLYQYGVSDTLRSQVQECVQKIADGFGIKDAPMLVQMLINNGEVYVIEFSVRTGGGGKFQSIRMITGVDIIDCVVELTMGKKPRISMQNPTHRYILDEYLYCKPGILNYVEGVEELFAEHVLWDMHIYRAKESGFDEVKSSGDRIAAITLVGDTIAEVKEKQDCVRRRLKVISESGDDILARELMTEIEEEEWCE